MTDARSILLSVLLGVAASTGCAARTLCNDAVDKLDDCGLPNDAVGSCDNARDECEARCIQSHSCDEIRGALTGTPNAYSACDDACS